MRHKNDNIDWEQHRAMRLELAELSNTRKVESQSLTDLEMVLTSSAIGFEYSLEALESEGELGPQSERIKMELEQFKQAYFDARLKMQILDETRLTRFERDLTAQKSIIFHKHEQEFLH